MRNSLPLYLLSFLFLFAFSSLNAQKNMNPQSEYAPNAVKQHGTSVQNAVKGQPFTLQFQIDLTNFGGSAGVETDGNYIYVTKWSDSLIWKFNFLGTLIDSFSIPGVSGLRDLAYDGTYFYGGAAGYTIYKMDFTNETLVGTISSPNQSVRSIAWVPDSNAFWCGNWTNDDFTLVDTAGNTLAQWASTVHGQTGIYGSAYDTVTPGGPYLWVINASGLNVELVQLDGVTGVPTGINIEVDNLIGAAPPGSGGGVFIEPNIFGNTVTIGGVLQNDKAFGYDLATFIPDSFDLSVTEILEPTTGYMLSNSETVKAVVKNYGDQSISSYQISYTINGGTAVNQAISNPIAGFGVDTITFTTGADLSTVASYDIAVYTTYASDAYNGNDTAYKTVVNTDNLVTVEIQTDAYGGETTWELVDNTTTNVVASGGPYPSNSVVYGYAQTDPTKCYTFYIYDSYGDGIAPGYYKVYWNTTLLGQNSSFSGSIDSMTVCKPSTDDIGVLAITSPLSACQLSNAEAVTVQVMNYGTASVSSFAVNYVLDGGTAVSENITQSLAPGDTLTHTFTTNADFSTSGAHSLMAYTTYASDGDNTNDTATATITHVANTTPPMNMGFEASDNLEGWKFIDANNDGSPWLWAPTSTLGNNGSGLAAYEYNTTNNADDWLVTTCLDLDASKTYQVSFYYAARSASYEEAMDVFIGTTQEAAGLTTQLADLPSITNESYQQHGANFTVSTSGVYYIGFHAKSQADKWLLMLDDVAVTEVTGIEQSKEQSLSVFPNPANDFVNINATNDVVKSVRVYNTLGQLVLSNTYNMANVNMNIASLTAGMYMLQIETENGVKTQKLEVQ